MSLLNPQSITETQMNVSVEMYKDLIKRYGESVSCPCSQINIPQKSFTSIRIEFHPVCSSIFVTEEWINALYLVDASGFDTLDFRQTAHSQVNENVFSLISSLILF